MRPGRFQGGNLRYLRMATTQQITDALIQEAITNAVQNVSRILIRQEAKFGERLSVEGIEAAPPHFQVMGNVGFVGDINGIVYLCMNDAFAIHTVGSILGMSAAEVEFNGHEVVKDAIGEVTNMMVGGFKNALCDVGFPCKLTLPTIVRGNHLKVSAIKGTARHIFRFDCGGGSLFADIQVKME